MFLKIYHLDGSLIRFGDSCRGFLLPDQLPVQSLLVLLLVVFGDGDEIGMASGSCSSLAHLEGYGVVNLVTVCR